MIAIIWEIFECNGPGCGPPPPSGPTEVALGLIVTAVALAPGILLHRLLRRRGR